MKPTYGRVSRHGIVPLSWSLDHVGPLAKTAEDAAVLLGVIAGPDPCDATCSARTVDNYRRALQRGIKGVKLGVPREHFFDVVDEEVRFAFDAAVTTMKRLGLRVRPVSVPSLSQAVAAELAIMMPEASAYHARALRERPDDFGADVRAFLELGRLVTATAMVSAQRLRARLGTECAAVFEQVDALIVPSLAIPAPRIAETEVHIDQQSFDVGTALSRNMMPFNLTGLPAISVPCGRSADGLPIGVQIVAKPFAESTVLRIAHHYERATEWHRLRPPEG